MKASEVMSVLIRQIRSITIEPVIFLYTVGFYITSGSELNKELIMNQICIRDLNFTLKACGNLSGGDQEYVQKLSNQFFMNSQFIKCSPAIVFAILLGALSDEFGRKPLILLPLIGYVIGFIFNVVFYAFIDSLPLEFMYLPDNINAFFGGWQIYSLGIFSFGTTITSARERSYRLARLEGTTTCSTMIGSLLSPIIFKNFGYFGNYVFSGGMTILAILYLLVFVHEPLRKGEESISGFENPKLECISGSKQTIEFVSVFEDYKPEIIKVEAKKKKKNCSKKIVEFLKKISMLFLIQPLRDMKRLVSKRRTTLLATVISLLIFSVCIFYFTMEVNANLRYQYSAFMFSPLAPNDYPHFFATMNFCQAFSLIVLMPIFSWWLEIHDALLGFVVIAIEAISFLTTPLALNWKTFYLAQGIGMVGLCKYSLLRSLLSKCVEENEIGKTFGLLAIAGSLIPLASNPIYRHLYKQTLLTVPGAVYYLAGALLLVAAFTMLSIFVARNRLRKDIEAMNAEVNCEATKF